MKAGASTQLDQYAEMTKHSINIVKSETFQDNSVAIINYGELGALVRALKEVWGGDIRLIPVSKVYGDLVSFDAIALYRVGTLDRKEVIENLLKSAKAEDNMIILRVKPEKGDTVIEYKLKLTDTMLNEDGSLKDDVIKNVSEKAGAIAEEHSLFDKIIDIVEKIAGQSLIPKEFVSKVVSDPSVNPTIKEAIKDLSEITTKEFLLFIVGAFVFGFVAMLLYKLLLQAILGSATKIATNTSTNPNILIQELSGNTKLVYETLLALVDYSVDGYSVRTEETAALEMADKTVFAKLTFLLCLIAGASVVVLGPSYTIGAVLGLLAVMLTVILGSVYLAKGAGEQATSLDRLLEAVGITPDSITQVVKQILGGGLLALLVVVGISYLLKLLFKTIKKNLASLTSKIPKQPRTLDAQQEKAAFVVGYSGKVAATVAKSKL